MSDAPPDLDDRDLIARAAAGDRAAFGTIVTRHRGAVWRTARALCRDDAAAEDVLQDTFVAALRGAATYRGDAPVRAWLLAIARHAAVRQGRGGRPVPTEEPSLEALALAAGWGAAPSPDDALDAEGARARLRAALAALPDDDRAVIALRDLDGLDGAQAAAALGLGVPAMKSRLHRARLRLAALLRGGAP